MKTVVLPTIPAVGTKMSPEEAMRLAIREAAKGSARVSPNPQVGAVVLDREGRYLASGYHEFYGGPHAEVNALKALSSEQLQGAHVFVTLEPCAHEGKTPSCAKMMAKLPLGKVVFGLVDPNPLVAGQGAEILKSAGIEAVLFSAEDKAVENEVRVLLEESCEAFLWNFRNKKVFVALKMASSLDGQVALRSGESQWITGPEAREYVHYLRACYDAVLVGKGTVEFDNPSLNIRHPTISKKNKVIVIDAEADLLPKYTELKMTEVHDSENLFWCVSADLSDEVKKQLEQIPKKPRVLFVKTKVGGDLDLEDLLSQLYVLGLRSVLVEGGAFTASSFINYSLVNRLYLFQAPILMGSGGSLSWTSSVRIATMSEKLKLQNPRYQLFGNDFLITGIL